MPGFQVAESDRRLVLSMPVDARRVAVGCTGFAAAFLCLTLIGAAGLWMEVTSPGAAGGGAESFMDPARNHFGFLWLLSLGLLAAFVPFYVWKVGRSGVVLAFDRDEGVLRRDNVVVCPLVRVELVRLAAVRDLAGNRLFRVSIYHDDGHELRVDESSDVDEVRHAGMAIADFLGVEFRSG